MHRLAATTAWSFGRDRKLLCDLVELFENHELTVHDAWSDADMNRTEITTSGPDRNQSPAIHEAAELVLPSIDLNRHSGTHPRTGALDWIRFEALHEEACDFGVGVTFGGIYGAFLGVPTYYVGPEGDPDTELQVIKMREAGFGGLGEVALHSTDGPLAPHPQWGVTVSEVGPRQTKAWLDLEDPTCQAAEQVAEALSLHSVADDVLLGVRGVGVAIPSRQGSRVLLTFEMPETTDFDAVLAVAHREARKLGAIPGKAHARGLWLKPEAERAGRYTIEPQQVLHDVLD